MKGIRKINSYLKSDPLRVIIKNVEVWGERIWNFRQLLFLPERNYARATHKNLFSHLKIKFTVVNTLWWINAREAFKNLIGIDAWAIIRTSTPVLQKKKIKHQQNRICFDLSTPQLCFQDMPHIFIQQLRDSNNFQNFCHNNQIVSYRNIFVLHYSNMLLKFSLHKKQVKKSFNYWYKKNIKNEKIH